MPRYRITFDGQSLGDFDGTGPTPDYAEDEALAAAAKLHPELRHYLDTNGAGDRVELFVRVHPRRKAAE